MLRQVHFKCNSRHYEMLRQLADEQDMSVSLLLRNLIRDLLRQRASSRLDPAETGTTGVSSKHVTR